MTTDNTSGECTCPKDRDGGPMSLLDDCPKHGELIRRIAGDDGMEASAKAAMLQDELDRSGTTDNANGGRDEVSDEQIERELAEAGIDTKPTLERIRALIEAHRTIRTFRKELEIADDEIERLAADVAEEHVWSNKLYQQLAAAERERDEAVEQREVLWEELKKRTHAANVHLDELMAQIKSQPHNGKTYQPDDVQYMLVWAEKLRHGFGFATFNPQWFVDQARLIHNTLQERDAANARAQELERSLAVANQVCVDHDCSVELMDRLAAAAAFAPRQAQPFDDSREAIYTPDEDQRQAQEQGEVGNE